MFPLETLLGHQSKMRRHEWSSFWIQFSWVINIFRLLQSRPSQVAEGMTKQQRWEKCSEKLVNRTKPWSGPGPWMSLCIIKQTHSPLCQSWCCYLVYLYHAWGAQRDATLHFLNWHPSITALKCIILLIWSDLGGSTRKNFCLLSILEQNSMRSS